PTSGLEHCTVTGSLSRAGQRTCRHSQRGWRWDGCRDKKEEFEVCRATTGSLMNLGSRSGGSAYYPHAESRGVSGNDVVDPGAHEMQPEMLGRSRHTAILLEKGARRKRTANNVPAQSGSIIH